MKLSPREKDKLLISVAADVAKKRLNRGLKLNYPEVVAIISDFVLEGARDGNSVADLMEKGGEIIKKNLHKEELIKIDADYRPIKAILAPRKNMDIGAGPGQELTTNIYGGEVGIILDGRERPIKIPNDVSQRIKYLRSWQQAVDEYPIV